MNIGRTVGWFTTLFPIKLALEETLGESIKTVKETLRAIPNKGIGYGELVGYEQGALPLISFNYLGQVDLANNQDQWGLVNEHAGVAMHEDNESSFAINIYAMVINGSLRVLVNGRVHASVLSGLATGYSAYLMELLQHCISKKDIEYTHSDFVNVKSEADLSSLPLIPRTEQYDLFEMTEIQKAYLLGRMGDYEIGNISNHIYSEYYYKDIDVSRLETVINYIINEMPILRTVFSIDTFKQRYLKTSEYLPISIQKYDYNEPISDNRLDRVRNQLSHKVYDPSQFPLFTFAASKFTNGLVLHISIDLILLDVKSRFGFFSLIDELYRKKDLSISKPSISFKDYQDYFQYLKSSAWYQTDKEYWKDKIESLPLRPSLPFKESPETISAPKFSDHTIYVKKEIWGKFKDKSQNYNLSYSAVLLAFYGKVIAYFSGKDEFLITLTLFNRYAIHPDVANIWGDFTSTTIFSYKDENNRFDSLLSSTHHELWDNIQHALYPGLEVIRDISKHNKLEANSTVSPIVFTGVIGGQASRFDGIPFLDDTESLSKRFWCGQTSQAWIDLQAIEVDDSFMSKWIYVEKLFSDGLQLAKYLRHCSQNKPQQPVTLIGVLCEKGYHQVLATTAIMKAGYAYLPLHVEWPAARCAEVLAQGNVSILLISASQYNQTELRNTFHDYELVVIGQDHPVPNDVTLPVVSADDVAYVIFTSGSTGKPKGVTISHRGALNTIDAVNRRFSVTFKDKIFALSELSFDLSVYDIFGLLAVGGKIVFPEQDKTKEPSYWLDVVNRYEVTLWNSVPQLASLLADEMEVSQVNHSSLRVFLLSGDWIPTNLPARIHKECPDACVMSLGGATEGSIWSIWYEIQHVDPIWKSIPYGMAMPNQAMYVLNAQGEHAPIGVIGEIHIGGMGVALNYWGDKNLTQLKYISHPVLGRLYKTGDLGRWHKNGYIEFAGRTDSQVKLNGYRVELEEIETVLMKIPTIKNSLVLLKEISGHMILAAYYVADEPCDEGYLLESLAQYLPEYMLPSVFVHLTELPLTTNGKVDRKALPDPVLNESATYAAPRSPLEGEICELWEEVLNLPKGTIGISDDFFRLGGDSIISIQLVSRMRQRFNMTLNVKDIFQNKTIERIVDAFKRQSSSISDVSTNTEQGILTGECDLLPIQSWYFENNFKWPEHWNQSFLDRKS